MSKREEIVYTDFDLDLEQQKVNVSRDEKKYWTPIGAWISGKINGGGPEFLFKNYSDNIYIRKRKQ